jgi:hypothetical protein
MRARRWGQVLLAAWILWAGEYDGETLVWRPLEGFPAQGSRQQTAERRCEEALDRRRAQRPDLAGQMSCLPHGQMPAGVR